MIVYSAPGLLLLFKSLFNEEWRAYEAILTLYLGGIAYTCRIPLESCCQDEYRSEWGMSECHLNFEITPVQDSASDTDYQQISWQSICRMSEQSQYQLPRQCSIFDDSWLKPRKYVLNYFDTFLDIFNKNWRERWKLTDSAMCENGIESTLGTP